MPLTLSFEKERVRAVWAQEDGTDAAAFVSRTPTSDLQFFGACLSVEFDAKRPRKNLPLNIEAALICQISCDCLARIICR